MKKIVLAALLAAATLTSCTMNNPLLVPSEAPHGAPAFDKIKTEHYKPAFLQAIKEGKAEVEAIVNNPEAPTFANTIEALAYAGESMTKVSNIFFNLNEACTNEAMQNLAEEISPLLTEFSMSIMLNPAIFARVKAVYEDRDNLSLTQEQAKLLEETYKGFVQSGANLSDEDKAVYAKLQEELSIATLQFGKNVLSATNAYTLHITDEADLAGLPQYVREMGAAEAAERGLEGWVYTLNYPSCSPFLRYSENRELRRQLWTAYNTKCVGGEYNNLDNIRKILDLRMKSASLLGYKTYAEYAIEDRMAKTPENVLSFLNDLREKSYPSAKRDIADIQKYAARNGFKEKLMPWDFSYWSEKYRDEKYSINEELLKPYFELSSVQAAIFDLANRLYGLQFVENPEIPVYHPDVKAFDVTDENGRFMAVLYIDYFPRESKRGGAWMTAFREQGVVNGVEQRPFVSLVTNFTKPTATEPSLLTFDEVTTILHEFGHGLHGMLAEGTYPSLTGTNVARDFVELPSQIMENWAYEPEYLKTFAKHYKTGEVIPQELIDKIVASKNYLAGYSCIRQLNYGLVDMDWHTLTSVEGIDPIAFEQSVVDTKPLLPSVKDVIFSPAFTHIFAGGYAAGYYSYKWAEVLEADAFSLFKEKGIFNREVASAFREKLLSKGGTVDADVLFRDFRGRDPRPEALLEKMGMK